MAPLRFDEALIESLSGADTLYNTYWIRFEREESTFTAAVQNTVALLDSAKRAGVRRIVHVSVSNPALDSSFPYFRGKAQTEAALRDSGVSYAVVRPTLVFGAEDILVNNIAWGLRRTPLFLVSGDGHYEVQPASVEDTAAICVDAGMTDDDLTWDAAGPERYSYDAFVRLIAQAVGRRARIWHTSTGSALAVARAVGLVVRDVVVTRDELDALEAGLLVSHEPPRGTASFADWLVANGECLGRVYTSELNRNFRG